MEINNNYFSVLNAVDVSSSISKKKAGFKELSYLSWSDAWVILKKAYPLANYRVISHPTSSMPFFYDDATGYMVKTEVTIDNLTHEMWLPVTDSANKAMKKEAYSYSTKKGDKQVEAATMFDINTAIMRCLVKNIALFGLGISLYSGEDISREADLSNKIFLRLQQADSTNDLQDMLTKAKQSYDDEDFKLFHIQYERRVNQLTAA